MNNFEKLAAKLDALPNGYPPAEDGSHLRILEKLFSAEEAGLAAELTPEPELYSVIAERTGRDPREVRRQLGSMAKRGLITIELVERKDHYALMPFVVGIYEFQAPTIDEELAELFENYFQSAFTKVLAVQPHFHRVVPVSKTIDNSMEIHPYENVTELVDRAQSWGVLDCICRKQQALIGKPCEHPLDVCMVLSARPNAFDSHPVYTALSREEAHAALKRAADAGLVHSVSNNQKDIYYICNCCTCGCGILRGMADLGAANVIARSAFVCSVDEDLCIACGVCQDYCQFGALTLAETMQADSFRCVGCGVCVPACPTEAMALVRRPEEDVFAIPDTPSEWDSQRASARGI